MIAIGSDHGGYRLKKEIEKYLEEKNIDLLKQAGVSNVVVGNALMKTKDKKDMINKLKN